MRPAGRDCWETPPGRACTVRGGDPAGAGLETHSLPATRAQVAHPMGRWKQALLGHVPGVPQQNGHGQGTPGSHLGTGTRQEL